MSTITRFTPEIDHTGAGSLSNFMEFDHIITSHGDMTVSDPVTGQYAPTVTMHPDEGDVYVSPEGDWELLDGFSGQWRYSGPVMHSSEFISGGLALEILEHVGLYVAVVVDMETCDECSVDNPEGCAGAHTKSTSHITGDVKCSCGEFYCEEEPGDPCSTEPAGWAIARYIGN